MLPNQAPQDVRDDVLLAVWTALSAEVVGGTISRGGSDGGGGSSDGGGGGGGVYDGAGRCDVDGRGAACGIPVSSLTALLSETACRSYGWKLTPPAARNNASSAGLRSEPTRRLWQYDKEEDGTRPLVGDDFAEMLQSNPQVGPVCRQLCDIFEANRRYRDRKLRDEKQSSRNEKVNHLHPWDHPPSEAWSGLTPTHGGRGESSRVVATPGVATPVQIAATSARFEEQLRAKERKIEALRKAEEARQDAVHTFEPIMAAVATPGEKALRRKAALVGQETGGGVWRRKSESGKGIRRKDIGQGLHSSYLHPRTTEERDVEDNCTFQPRLYEPLPLPPPLYPALKTQHGEMSNSGQHPVASAGIGAKTTTPATLGDRATASWKHMVDRLKAGRRQRLRRLQEEHAAEVRSEPVPPSVQQLFADAGIETCSHENQRHPETTIARTRKQAGGSANKERGGNRTPRSPERPCRQDQLLRARTPPKGKLSEEHSRKKVNPTARRQGRKLVMASSFKRSAAVVGFEKALSERGTERGLLGLDDAPPLLIAEVEFARRKGWVLLALWRDTCPREAAGQLVKHHTGLASGVASDLEKSFRSELQHACSRTTDLGMKQKRGSSGRKEGRDDNSRRVIPKTVLRVEA